MRKEIRRPTVLYSIAAMLVGAIGLLSYGYVLRHEGNPSHVPASETQVRRGRYLVTAVAACADCHSAAARDKSPSGPLWLAGYVPNTPGQPFQIGPYKTYPSNITPDVQTGIGNWTPLQMFNALRTGKEPSGRYLCPSMPWPVYRNMTDDDLWSVVAYLRSIKPVHNAVPESEGPGAAPGKPGDWSGAYQQLPVIPPYPAVNELPAGVR